MLFSIGLAYDAIKLPMTERLSIVHVLGAAVNGETFRGLIGFDGIGMALFAAVLFGKQFIRDVGDIAEVNIAIKGSGTDSPLPFLFLDVYDSIYGNALLDLCCDFSGVGMIFTEFDFRAFRSGLIVRVVLGNLGGIMVGPFCCFCAKVFIKTMLYFAVDRGRSEAEILCYIQAGMAGVIERFNTEPI